MKRLYVIGSLMLATVLVLALMGYNTSSSKAMPLLGFTDTPTAEPPDTPVPPTDTPEPRDTLTPTNTPPPGPQNTPVPATPTAAAPVGTVTLPTSGDATATPPWLLLSVAGGFLALGAHLLRRSNRSL